MKMRVFALVGLGVVAGSALVLAQDEKPKAPAAAKPAAGAATGGGDVKKDTKSKASYAIGLEHGRTLKERVTGLDLDADAFLKGVRASLTGGESALSEAECNEALAAFQKDLTARNEKKMRESAPVEIKAQAEKNQKEGDAFLAANKTKAGVKTTESGLQYLVEREGKGATPKASDTVKVHYRGTLTDGKTEFDSSLKRGQPATFRVGQVIPGWVEGLQLMKVGSKYKFFIPSDLAYGFRGSPPDIGPNSVLVFEVELLGIE